MLFVSEEKDRIWKVAEDQIRKETVGTEQDKQEAMEEILLSKAPIWDPNTAVGMHLLVAYHRTLLTL